MASSARGLWGDENIESDIIIIVIILFELMMGAAVISLLDKGVEKDSSQGH